jgi:uncharacterized protein (TIGR02301 family)
MMMSPFQSRIGATALAALFCLVFAGHGMAQQQRPAQRAPAQPPAATPAPQPPPPEPPPAPYEPQLLRLSEIMGALAFLRDLCTEVGQASDATLWRQRMSELIEAEAISQARKERLAGAFNRGFRGFQQNYRRCTPSAKLAIERYLNEGTTLTRELTNRYGGS